MNDTRTSSASATTGRARRAACARRWKQLRPDCVLVEGPPDAEALIPLLAHPEMRPPVALLVYAPDEPRRAVYYPFAVFSPEWQAMHFAPDQRHPRALHGSAASVPAGGRH